MTETTTEEKQPVDRARRFKFIAYVTSFCLLSALCIVLLALMGASGGAIPVSPLLDLYVRSVLGLATATVVSYVSGSVIDYNGGIGNLFSKEPPKG